MTASGISRSDDLAEHIDHAVTSRRFSVARTLISTDRASAPDSLSEQCEALRVLAAPRKSRSVWLFVGGIAQSSRNRQLTSRWPGLPSGKECCRSVVLVRDLLDLPTQGLILLMELQDKRDQFTTAQCRHHCFFRYAPAKIRRLGR